MRSIQRDLMREVFNRNSYGLDEHGGLNELDSCWSCYVKEANILKSTMRRRIPVVLRCRIPHGLEYVQVIG